MKKWLIPILIIAVLVIYGIKSYNGMITQRNAAEKQWANVESAYQRRADLVPNLVSTVKGYAAHEKETLEGVVNARAKATSTTIDVANATPEQLAQFQQAQQGLTSALSRLLVTVEKYPDLKANQSFLDLQSQLEGTENRINTERNRFNEVATTYRNAIQKFPNNIFAGMFGFDAMPLFSSAEGSDVAPNVQF
ncbi:LemA family protein [Flavobacteriaceae bacterium F08102]|nr:LemA family protein [Flavobacteriaceae bacterium F08102]